MKNLISSKVIFIIGTRPEAIKLAPLILKFNSNKKIKTFVFLTGQHGEMVTKVLEIFKIKPDYNLNLLTVGQPLNYITSKIINGLQKIFLEEKPNLVIVQGDTNSAFAGALSAFYQKIPVAHVEAGLRTNDIFNPYPEEANRKLISQIASLNFAPTKLSAKNLEDEKVLGEVFVTGNTVIDAVLMVSRFYKENSSEFFNDPSKKIIFTTVHRRENWGNNIKNISNAINSLVKANKQIQFIIPMHPNPLVRKNLKEVLIKDSRISLIEPLTYDSLVNHIKNSYMILTDSGGLQEEAPSFGKPVLILRDNTERPEAVDAGTAKLIGTNTERIFDEVNLLLNNEESYNKMSKAENPYGDGKSSERILEHCKNFLEIK